MALRVLHVLNQERRRFQQERQAAIHNFTADRQALIAGRSATPSASSADGRDLDDDASLRICHCLRRSPKRSHGADFLKARAVT
jgi:hypothetical protein